MFLDCLLDAVSDSIKLLPFLLVIYIIIELVEHKAGDTFIHAIQKNTRFGPLIGSALGIIPQCGFSAAAASLFSERFISIGTMIAIFFSTSDEMLPILLSANIPVNTIVKILLVKVIISVLTGFGIDFLYKIIKKKNSTIDEIPDHKESCHASGYKQIFGSGLVHALQIFAYILIFSFLINLVISFIGESRISGIFNTYPILGQMIAAVVGLIPNCASSVIITSLYIDGFMSAGALFSGLLVNAGVGLLVLLKTNKSAKLNICIIAGMYIVAVIWGILIDLLQIAF